MYISDELKTYEDCYSALDEVLAYASLEGVDFNFGDGLISHKMSLGSEDAYYEMCIQNILELIGSGELDHSSNRKKKKCKINRYELMKTERIKIGRLSKYSHFTVYDRGDWKQRIYRRRTSSHLKKVSNKKVRTYKGDLSGKNNLYRKVYDFWWNLY